MRIRSLLGIGTVAVAACLTLFGACSHAPDLAPGNLPTLVFDVDAVRRGDTNTFFHAPFPSAARLNAAGAPDVAAVPNPGAIAFVKAAKALIDDEGTGVDPSAAIYFRFDRPLHLTPDVVHDTLKGAPGIWIIDIDPTSWAYGERIPALVRLTSHHDGVRPAHLLQVLPVPGRGGFEGKTHAVVVLRDIDQDGVDDLAESSMVQALLGQSATNVDDKWHRSFGPLRDFLDRTVPVASTTLAANEPRKSASANAGAFTRAAIAAATVYDHGTPTKDLFRLVHRALNAPAPALATPLKIERAYDDYVVVTGALKMPIYQAGEPPHFFGSGEISRDSDDNPTILRHEAAPFMLTIPRRGQEVASSSSSSEKTPLYFYIHGTGGLASQAIDRGYRPTKDAVSPKGSGLASWVAPDGIATACIAGPYSPDRVGWRALDGYGAYVFFHPRAMRDNFVQMLLEQAHFLRFLTTTTFEMNTIDRDPSVKAAVDGLTAVQLTPSVVGGQSLGSYLSGMFAALSGAFDGAILTGAGGSWIEFGFGPKDPIDLARVLDVVAAPKGEALDRFHPFISLFQTAVGPADNTHYTPYLVRRPTLVDDSALPLGNKTPHVLIIEGEADLQVPTHLQRALVLSVGAPLVGDDVGPVPDQRLLPALRFGAQGAVAKAEANVLSASGEERTVGAVRYLEDGILEGHYVVFQRSHATSQLKAFARAVSRQEVPTIVPPVRQAEPSRQLLAPVELEAPNAREPNAREPNAK